jgi:SPP1 family predicted phage head-tail adaptor
LARRRLDGSLPLNPGFLRERVTIQRKTVSGQNSRNEDTITYPAYLSCWMWIGALIGREFETAQQKWAEARFKCRMPYPPSGFTIQRADRIAWGSRTLDILDAEDPDGMRREIVIYAQEVL